MFISGSGQCALDLMDTEALKRFYKLQRFSPQTSIRAVKTAPTDYEAAIFVLI
jgi:hypothetical protein